LAQSLIRSLNAWSADAALLLVFLFTTLLAKVMSNAATLALLIPVASQLAVGLALPPLALVCAVLFGASQSLLSPVGHETNLMVFGSGRYRFLDIPRYGLPLTPTMTVIVPFLICRHFNL
jgi:di/tricarboxylate transporter